MTKNLDLAGGTTLTSEKSNVVDSYTLPASSAAVSGTNNARHLSLYNNSASSVDTNGKRFGLSIRCLAK